MRCLHCGNRISLLRKLKDSEFCSDDHRDHFALQQQQMAVSRLMETSSPKHKQLPELMRVPDPERALPKGVDRRGLAAAPLPTPPVAAAATPPPPPPPPVKTAAAVASPVHRSSTRHHEFVPHPPAVHDWSPRRWRTVPLEPEDLIPMLADPRMQYRPWRRLVTARMQMISGSREWSRPGRFAALPYCEAPASPASPATFSEILSLSMNGFVCERSLAVDDTPYAAPPRERNPVREAEAGMAASAEAGLGAKQLPQAQRGALVSLTVEPPAALPPNPVPSPSGLPRAALRLRGKLPEIDWTVERLDRAAARHEPGLVRLRSPRVRSPQLARLVKPAAGGSGPPIRVRPGVRPPGASHFRLALSMPVGAKVAMGFDRAVAGTSRRLEIREGWQDLKTAIRLDARAPFSFIPGMPPLAAMVQLTLCSADGLLLTDSSAPEFIERANFATALPRSPYVRGNEFDPPMGGLVQPAWQFAALRAPAASMAKPSVRPVVSYRWVPVRPEFLVAPDFDWHGSAGEMAQLSLEMRVLAAPAPLASADMEPIAPVAGPDLSAVRLPAAKPVCAATRPSAASRMFPLSLDKVEPRNGKEAPVSRLEPIAPKPGHQLRKSTLKTQADWQRNRWASASVYGSALWRIAIGKFSGALDQAPKGIRWVAGVMALGLGAFALLPNSDPAPRDTAWTMANTPPASAAAGSAAASVPPPVPRRPKVPVTRVAVSGGRAAKPVRVQPASEVSLTSAWDNFQKRLSDRAAIAFTDDFRNGLADWEGAGDWARSWSYDASGFVRTGGLALLAPMRDLTDYRMEFLGQIERRSMGWVVRAADLRNYYALKLTIVGDGPVPEVALIRYPVINGVAGPASQQILPLDVRGDTVYRVQTEVRDDYFAVIVQGKVVDSWTDGRLKRGSIGLFSGKGELARVRWVGIWHQYDTLGRLCALLAPGGLPGRERGANQ